MKKTHFHSGHVKSIGASWHLAVLSCPVLYLRHSLRYIATVLSHDKMTESPHRHNLALTNFFSPPYVHSRWNHETMNLHPMFGL